MWSGFPSSVLQLQNLTDLCKEAADRKALKSACLGRTSVLLPPACKYWISCSAISASVFSYEVSVIMVYIRLI